MERPGALDDPVIYAIMLDAMRIFVFCPNSLTKDLTFLFSWSEESILSISQTFVAQHPWTKGIAAFPNLEGAGSVGWLIMFQSGLESGAESLVKTLRSFCTALW